MRTFGWFLGLILVGFGCIAAFTYPAWLILHPHFSFPFHRIGERIGMLALLVGLVGMARRLGLADRTSLGYGVARPQFIREMLLALALGVVTMAAVVGLMSALRLLAWSAAAAQTTAQLIQMMLAKLLSGFAVAFIEETFIRGAMLSGIKRESGAAAAIVLTALVYSATHFFASSKIPSAEVTAFSGIALVSGTLHLFADPLTIADAFLCLFAVGIVLGTIRVTTGNIAACVGLHAGWVWVMLMVHEFSQPQRSAPGGFLLSRFDGFIGWLVLAWTLVIGVGLHRFYVIRESRSP
jgi:membrane protease YdiL (CAAX protease family)